MENNCVKDRGLAAKESIEESRSPSAGHFAKANAAYPEDAASAAKTNGLATASAVASP